MATASTVQLSAQQKFQFAVPDLTSDAAQTTSKLLQDNHEQHHIFFNQQGFHNHVAHHLVTIFALGASPKELQQQYANNQGYQRPLHRSASVQNLVFEDEAAIMAHLGKGRHYPDFLAFFQSEISKSSWQEVLQKYLLSGTALAETLFIRLWSSIYHPLIHLGFAIESAQPALVAEALAETAVHDAWIGNYLKPAEAAANGHRDRPSKSIVELIEAMHSDQTLRDAVRWSDSSMLRDGIISRAGERMVGYASQYQIRPMDDIKYKTAEMINAVAYFTGGAQRDDYEPKYDFYYIHSLNSSIFFSTFLEQEWLSDARRRRLLEWKVWNDLIMYASRKVPEPRLAIVRAYRPKQPSGWEQIFDRVKTTPDDGHAAKLVRALAHGQRVCMPYEDRTEFRLKHHDWLQLGHMAIDSIEAGGPTWVRSTGFDEAWDEVPRAQL
ncbi:hypothetical protein B0A48_07386 [Cryoendolithus antarcticus]|uniref:HypA-like protein n=1 Tax=Cryoendolithus antarcticus TaxID=1507870 RepID=A0A1V8T8L9_9PEZI|nr:hypothetical protein B0A48_07386 [Cryoendolithus antarcticus]